MKINEIFGKPGEGIHSYRFLDTAIIDYLLAILGAILLTYYSNIPLVISTIIVLMFGILLHLIFNVNTNTTKYLNEKTGGNKFLLSAALLWILFP